MLSASLNKTFPYFPFAILILIHDITCFLYINSHVSVRTAFSLYQLPIFCKDTISLYQHPIFCKDTISLYQLPIFCKDTISLYQLPIFCKDTLSLYQLPIFCKDTLSLKLGFNINFPSLYQLQPFQSKKQLSHTWIALWKNLIATSCSF